jgi:ER protein Pkr1
MASFLEDLWGSIFTPGPTPTLVVATNVTFAVLQAVLAALLLLTHSIHLAVLSALCGGLWWGINWFVAELQKAEKAEEEARRLRKRRTLREGSGKSDEGDVEDDEDDEDEDENDYDDETETELAARAAREETPTGNTISAMRVRGGPQKILAVMQSAAAARRAGVLEADEPDEASSSGVYVRGGPGKFAAMAEAQAADAQAAAGADARAHRSGGENGESGSASTDSEWEKVSDR